MSNLELPRDLAELITHTAEIAKSNVMRCDSVGYEEKIKQSTTEAVSVIEDRLKSANKSIDDYFGEKEWQIPKLQDEFAFSLFETPEFDTDWHNKHAQNVYLCAEVKDAIDSLSLKYTSNILDRSYLTAAINADYSSSDVAEAFVHHAKTEAFYEKLYMSEENKLKLMDENFEVHAAAVERHSQGMIEDPETWGQVNLVEHSTDIILEKLVEQAAEQSFDIERLSDNNFVDPHEFDFDDIDEAQGHMHHLCEEHENYQAAGDHALTDGNLEEAEKHYREVAAIEEEQDALEIYISDEFDEEITTTPPSI